MNKETLIASAEEIRDEYKLAQNTAKRVGSLFVDIINYTSGVGVSLNGLLYNSDSDGVIKLPDYPSRLTELDNDAHYITSSALVGYATENWSNGRFALKSHNHNWSDVINTPTTLAGYGITDALGKSENAVSASKLSIQRTIWGRPFDGTQNVLGDMAGVGHINMTGDINIGAGKIRWNNKGYFELLGDLAVGGAIVMNADLGNIDIPTIWESLPIDNKTIVRAPDGTLSAVGGGGELTDITIKLGDVIYNSINGTVSLPKYPSKVRDLENDLGFITANALSGYATEMWVKGQGYLTQHQSLEGYATQSWARGEFALKSHNHSWSDVINTPTTLLGYGIADAVTLNSPQTILGTKIFSSSRDGLDRYLEVDGVRLNLRFSPTFMEGFAYGLQYLHGNRQLFAIGAYGSSGEINYGYVGRMYNDTIVRFYPDNTSRFYGNVTAPRFIGLSDQSTKLATPRSIWGHLFDGTQNLTSKIAWNYIDNPTTLLGYGITDAVAILGDYPNIESVPPIGVFTARRPQSDYYSTGGISFGSSSYGATIIGDVRGGSAWFQGNLYGVRSEWREFAFKDDNVASATKLHTPRSIWGQLFDGTKDILGDLFNVKGIYMTDEIKGVKKVIFDGGGEMYYDSELKAFVVDKPLLVKGGVTMNVE